MRSQYFFLKFFGATFLTLIALMFEAAVLVADGNHLDDKLVLTGIILAVWAFIMSLIIWGDA